MSALDELFGGTTRLPLDQEGWDAGVDASGQVTISRAGVTVGLTSVLSEKIRAGFHRLEPRDLRIVNGWLVEDAGMHTCGAGVEESGYLHEPGCGWVPLVDLSKLQGWPGVCDE